ncbi:hypothetical protein T11_10325, partial [Trichinella zimbabwensis]
LLTTSLKMANVSGEGLNVYLKKLLLKHCCTLEMIQRIQSLHCIRIEDTGHEYTNIRYSAEAASNQVIPISPSPFGLFLFFKRIEDTGHEYTNIRYSGEAASNQVIPISPSPFGSSMRPCNHPQCEACSSTPVVYQLQLIPHPRPKKVPRNPLRENS